MRHFVHGTDGNKYGPADFATLQQWRNEGRLTAETLIEPEVGGIPFQARNLPGLFDTAPPVDPYSSNGPGYATYPYMPPPAQNIQGFATAAWILGLVAVCACWPVLGPLSVYCAFRANAGGYPLGKVLIGYTIVGTILGAVFGIAATMNLMRMGWFR